MGLFCIDGNVKFVMAGPLASNLIEALFMLLLMLMPLLLLVVIGGVVVAAAITTRGGGSCRCKGGCKNKQRTLSWSLRYRSLVLPQHNSRGVPTTSKVVRTCLTPHYGPYRSPQRRMANLNVIMSKSCSSVGSSQPLRMSPKSTSRSPNAQWEYSVRYSRKSQPSAGLNSTMKYGD